MGTVQPVKAISCSSTGPMAMLGGVDQCIFVMGKPCRAWVGAWVHGMVGLQWGCCFIMLGPCFGVPEPVTSLMGGCYMNWILIF